MYTYRFSAYNGDGEFKYPSLRDAVEAAVEDTADGYTYAKDIRDKSGKIVMSHDDIVREYDSKFEDEPWDNFIQSDTEYDLENNVIAIGE